MKYNLSSFEVALYNLDTGALLGKVKDARIQTDQGWSPRWTASVTVHGDIDPTTIAGDHVGLRVRRMSGAAIPLSEWTARWGGAVSAYTALGAGSFSASDITHEIGGEKVGFLDWYAPENLDLHLYMLNVERHLADGTTEFTLASGEVVLQHVRRMSLTDHVIVGLWTVIDLVRYVLAQVEPSAKLHVVGFTPDNSPPNSPPEDLLLFGDIVWRAGDSAWDVLDQWLTANRLPLYSEKRGEYTLVGPLGDTEAIIVGCAVDESIKFDLSHAPPEKTESYMKRVTYRDTNVSVINGWGVNGIARGIVDEYTVGGTVPASARWSPTLHYGDHWRDYSSARITRPAELWHRPNHSAHLYGVPGVKHSLEGDVAAISWSFPEGIEEISVVSLEATVIIG